MLTKLVLLLMVQTASALAPVKNIAYQNTPRSQKLDIYFPKTPPPYKTVMLIHGGCFMAGSKDATDTADYVSRLLGLGYAVVNVNYRLTIPDPKDPAKSVNPYPVPLDDVQEALCWLGQNGGAFHLDTSQIVAMGYSAGATLANYLGTGHNDGRPPKCSTRVSAVIDFFGRTNFLKSTESYKDENGMDCGENFVGERRNDTHPQAEFHAADILTNVDLASAVPTLIVHGDADGAVNVEHSLGLCAQLQDRCTLKIIPGADHMFKMQGEMDTAYAEVARFLARKVFVPAQDEPRLANLRTAVH